MIKECILFPTFVIFTILINKFIRKRNKNVIIRTDKPIIFTNYNNNIKICNFKYLSSEKPEIWAVSINNNEYKNYQVKGLSFTGNFYNNINLERINEKINIKSINNDTIKINYSDNNNIIYENLELKINNNIKEIPIVTELPKIYKEEYYCENKSNKILVISLKYNYNYEDFRIFCGNNNLLYEQKIISVNRIRNGGTTTIIYGENNKFYSEAFDNKIMINNVEYIKSKRTESVILTNGFNKIILDNKDNNFDIPFKYIKEFNVFNIINSFINSRSHDNDSKIEDDFEKIDVAV